MELWLYCKALGKHWWSLLSCAIFTLISIIAAWMNKSNGWVAGMSAATAVILLFVASALAWNDQYKRTEQEKAKNEVAPKMDISVLNIISRGSLGAGLTDLFINLRVVLGEPSEVSIKNFTLGIFDESRSMEFISVDDVGDWEVMKETEDGYARLSCVALAKELAVRGDPVQGWKHFPIWGITESFVQSRTLAVEINCTHGTCYSNFQGAHVFSDPRIKGVMSKIQKS